MQIGSSSHLQVSIADFFWVTAGTRAVRVAAAVAMTLRRRKRIREA